VCDEATLVEDFIPGEAVRIMRIGQRSWQIRLAGEDWRKSIHPDQAAFMEPDPRLVEDTRRLAERFRLEVIGVDYVVDTGGTPHLLEVNHIPNVTRFPEVRAAYLDYAAAWLDGAGVDAGVAREPAVR
jgi:glutathione synthase/RimK-type ligase-like ATP-grasp enzyme